MQCSFCFVYQIISCIILSNLLKLGRQREMQKRERLQLENPEVLAFRFYNSISNGHSFIYSNIHIVPLQFCVLLHAIFESKLHFVERNSLTNQINLLPYCLLLQTTSNEMDPRNFIYLFRNRKWHKIKCQKTLS